MSIAGELKLQFICLISVDAKILQQYSDVGLDRSDSGNLSLLHTQCLGNYSSVVTCSGYQSIRCRDPVLFLDGLCRLLQWLRHPVALRSFLKVTVLCAVICRMLNDARTKQMNSFTFQNSMTVSS